MLHQFENAKYDDTNGLLTSNGQEINLTKIQKKLLDYFIAHPKQVLSKQKLMDQVWGRTVTENSIDQVISKLRNQLENDPKNPQILVTHFGHGISFDYENPQAIVQQDTLQQSQVQQGQARKILPLALFLLLSSLGLSYYLSQPKVPISISEKVQKSRKIVVLPMTFEDSTISSLKQQGMNNALLSTVNALDSEGEVLFDETSLSSKQAIEKHWQLEDDLLILRSQIKKNGDLYQATMELTNGIDSYQTTHLTATSLNELVNSQIAFIADYNHSLTGIEKTIGKPESTDKYIEAMGYQKAGDLDQAKTLLKQVLFAKEDNYQARMSLAEVLFELKEFDASLSQLTTLKSTKAYQVMATDIELGLAKIQFANKQYQKVIDDLINFQATHLNISPIKKAKVLLQLAQAHAALGQPVKAITFYQQSLLDLNATLNPMIFARSYYGQADVLLTTKVDDKVYALYKKAHDYAVLAQDLPFQIKALNKMSFISMNNYDWANAIKLTRQVISLHELSGNKNQVGLSLGNLVAILNLRGQFTQAQEVNEHLGSIAQETQSNTLTLHYLHYKAVLSMNHFDWIGSQQTINEQLQLAIKVENYPMQLNNAFLQLELILLEKDTDKFMSEWNQRMKKIKELGFERYKIYMDLYLARYYALIEKDEKAIEIYKKVSEQSLSSKDIKIYIDAQTRLAKVLLKTDVVATLKLLNNLEQYNPHPNPYLDLKAKALYNLGKNIEALNILNQAKLVYHESWTAENQSLLETVKNAIKNKP